MSESQERADSGIYIHIPFCKKACHYCDFHFSTSVRKKPQMMQAICRELEMRKQEVLGQVATIYFGGGTPSLLDQEELEQVIDQIYNNYNLAGTPEITLEANPDDLSENKISMLAQTPVNRLSIGVQSFFEKDLQLMNRAHNQKEAFQSIKKALEYFDNVSVDLIYGIPGMSNERWRQNLDIILDLGIPHVSTYALTVEPKTALDHMIQKGKIKPPAEETLKEQYDIMIEKLTTAGFENYEFSNFGKNGFYSRNNSAYWSGMPYLGIGPSAHSFDGKSRKWNVSNNPVYTKAIEQGELPAETEDLTPTDKYNEYIMTRLRTREGIDLDRLEIDFGVIFREHCEKEAEPLLEKGLLELTSGRLHVTRRGKFLSDGIAAELFLVNSD